MAWLMQFRTHLLEPAHAHSHAAAGPALNGPRRLALCVGAQLAAPRAWPELAHHGWRCHHVTGFEQAVQAVAAIGFDALLLGDAALAGDFVPRLTALRRAFAGPLLVLAARSDEIDEILALELGADDYLRAPLTAHRLRARLGAALRTPAAQSLSLAAVDEAMPVAGSAWSVDQSQGLLRGPGHALRLSAAQAAVMAFFLVRAGEVVTRTELARHLHMPFGPTRGRAVDMRVHNLRRRLAKAGVDGLSIDTVRGFGYALQVGVARDLTPSWRRASGSPATHLVAVA